MSRSFAARLSAVALGLHLAGGCDVTGDGSSGDPPSEPKGDLLGDGSRIHEIVGPATWLNPADLMSDACSVPIDRQVRATGQIIVGIDRFDETGDGQTGNIYIQDYTPPGEQPLPYSGMTVFGASFTPPDLRVFEGDVVDTFGNLTEFLGPGVGKYFGECKTLPEIGGTMNLRFDGASIEPLVVVPGGTPNPLCEADEQNDRFCTLKGYVAARQWMGMLVKVQGVNIVGTPDDLSMTGGRYDADIDMGGGIPGSDVVRISNELFDLQGVLDPDRNDTYDVTRLTSVTGVLTYFYGFKIAPRSAEDIEI